MSRRTKRPPSPPPAFGFARPDHAPSWHRLAYAILLVTPLATMAWPGATFARDCTGLCLLDRLFLPSTGPTGDRANATREAADGDRSSAPWSLPNSGLTGSAPRWTVSAEAIVLSRIGGVGQTLVARLPGDVQFFATAVTPGSEALNSNQFQQGFSAGPKLSLIYHGDSGYSAEISYFNIFNQRDTRTIGPDSPADWLVMKGVGAFWQTQDFPYQGMAWDATTNLYNVEANGRLDLAGRVTVLAGFRWLQLNDGLQGTLTPADQTAPTWKNTNCGSVFPQSCTLFQITAGNTPAGNYPPFWTSGTINNLYGAQIGVAAKVLELGRFSVDGLMKAGLFDNHAEQSTVVSMQKVLYPSRATTDHAAFVGEIGLQLKYRITQALGVKVGYEALWLAGVALAPGQIGETFTTPSSVTALGVNCGSHVLFQGATAGLEYSF